MGRSSEGLAKDCLRRKRGGKSGKIQVPRGVGITGRLVEMGKYGKEPSSRKKGSLGEITLRKKHRETIKKL